MKSSKAGVLALLALLLPWEVIFFHASRTGVSAGWTVFELVYVIGPNMRLEPFSQLWYWSTWDAVDFGLLLSGTVLLLARRRLPMAGAILMLAGLAGSVISWPRDWGVSASLGFSPQIPLSYYDSIAFPAGFLLAAGAVIMGFWEELHQRAALPAVD